MPSAMEDTAISQSQTISLSLNAYRAGRILIAINASESDFTIHHGELLGTFTDLLKSGSGNISQTLNGSLDLPAYSVQYLKEIS